MSLRREGKSTARWFGQQRIRLWLQLWSDKDYESWRLQRAADRLLDTLPPAAILGVVMMSLHCWEGHISPAGCFSTCCVLLAECFFSGFYGMSTAWSLLPSLSKRFQLVLFTLQELLLMISALQIEADSSRQLFYMSTVMPFFLIFSTIGYVPLGLFLGVACPVHLGCWFLCHGSFSIHLLALGLMHCFGALMVYLLVEEAELENFNVLRKLTLEQKYMETMHSSLQGMLSSIFDASCICNEEGDIRCWAQSPHRNDEALLSLVNVTSLLDLSLDPKERESIIDFLQRMSVKAASSTDRVGTLTLKLKKAVPLEVQLTGIKVPARRSSNRRSNKSEVESNEEGRMLIGLKLSQGTELRSGSKGRVPTVSESPIKTRRSSTDNRPGTPQSNKAKSLDEPPMLRVPSKSRETRENREIRDPPVLKHMDTPDIACLADDEGRERMVLQRAGARSAAGPSRLQQRAKGKGLTLGMDCNKITRETTETFVDAHDHYEMLEQLGRGSVATVRKAIRKKDGLVVSLKISGSKDKSALVEAEFKMLQSIKHPNIIRAFDYLETSVSSILVLEYFDGSSLEEAVHQSSLGHFPELTARELFRALLSAVCYLHSHRIIHRDVKPSNVMVSASLSDLRLLDFNVAKRLTEGGALTVTGTRLYFAPEVINGEPPSEANDVWGCGICVFYMLAGRLPWKNLPEGVFVDHPELKVQGSWCQGLSEPCRSVIRQCLTVESHWRPPVRTIMLHEWFWTDGCDPCSDVDVNADVTLHRSARKALRRTTL